MRFKCITYLQKYSRYRTQTLKSYFVIKLLIKISNIPILHIKNVISGADLQAKLVTKFKRFLVVNLSNLDDVKECFGGTDK